MLVCSAFNVVRTQEVIQGTATGVDAQGFITILPVHQVQPVFEALIDDVRTTLAQALGERLHSLYLYGSIANGTATPGVSDLDLSLVLQDNDAQTITRLAALKTVLQDRHTQVTKIDFDIGLYDEVLACENRLSWGYWLKHHCRCILGDDLSRHFEPFRPSRAIALAVNDDFHTVLTHYADRLAHETCPRQILCLQREAARKLLRATNILRTDDEPGWPLTLENHADLFSRRTPSMQKQIRFFLAQAQGKHVPAASFVVELRAFIHWLQTQTTGPSRKGSRSHRRLHREASHD